MSCFFLEDGRESAHDYDWTDRWIINMQIPCISLYYNLLSLYIFWSNRWENLKIVENISINETEMMKKKVNTALIDTYLLECSRFSFLLRLAIW